MFDKQDSMYHFLQFVYQTKHMLYGIKKVNKFKSKKSKLRKLVYECIDDILTDIMHDVFEYVTIPHVLKDNKCLDVYISYVVAIIIVIHLHIIFQLINEKLKYACYLAFFEKYSLQSLFIVSIALFKVFILFLSWYPVIFNLSIYALSFLISSNISLVDNKCIYVLKLAMYASLILFSIVTF